MDIRKISDTELAAAIEAARSARRAAWAAWELVRDAGETSCWCKEFQAHQALERPLGDLLGEDYRRDFDRKLRMFAPAPMGGRENYEAWISGPGSEAR